MITYIIKYIKYILIFIFIATLTNCTNQKIPLIIKTGFQPFLVPFDSDATEAYTFLNKVAKDFCTTNKNISINITQYESARATEELQKSFNTPDSPDIIFASQFNQSTYIHKGVLVPLDDIITPDIRADIPIDLWENCIVDNKTYMIPFITMQNVLCYNQKLFRDCSLDKYCTPKISENQNSPKVIQNWSLDEWGEIMDTLHKNLPPNHYSAMMYSKDNQGDTHIMMFMRAQGSNIFNSDGHVDLTKTIIPLQWIRDCAKNGYFPPHSDRLCILDNYELFIAGLLGIYICNASIQKNFDENNIDYGLVNYPSVEQNGLCTSFDMSFGVVDNGNKKRLKIAKDFIKYIYESNWLDYSSGCIPVSKKVAQKYKNELINVAPYLDNKARNVNYTLNSPNWLGVRSIFYKHIIDVLATNKDIAVIAKELEDDMNYQIDSGRVTSNPHQ